MFTLLTAKGDDNFLFDYRTFVTIKSYTFNDGIKGEQSPPFSLELKLPGQEAITLQSGTKYTAITNEKLEIGQTYEVLSNSIENDAFTFTVQLLREGAKFQECIFNVKNNSKYSRSYRCYASKDAEKLSDQISDEIEVSVYTDRPQQITFVND